MVCSVFGATTRCSCRWRLSVEDWSFHTCGVNRLVVEWLHACCSRPGRYKKLCTTLSFPLSAALRNKLGAYSVLTRMVFLYEGSIVSVVYREVPERRRARQKVRAWNGWDEPGTWSSVGVPQLTRFLFSFYLTKWTKYTYTLMEAHKCATRIKFFGRNATQPNGWFGSCCCYMLRYSSEAYR